MDAMEDMDLLSGSNTQINKMEPTATNATVVNVNNGEVQQQQLQQQQQQPQVLAVATTTKGPQSAAIRYRHVGKSGLKISNMGLGN